eukprot:TRINITY_DN5971_c0_g2_i1.p1 TRINITY_DN5971_c0_g2~~TRINITY_DN5971_c0_g2_i1.p1  ORF type:complete len:250 (-),score=16.03 TRINITY_DN5971_c0_g2_i1:239-988(-)
MRTTMNYQYRFGGKMIAVIKSLYKEGGFFRFYRGLAPALIQGPVSRFGDAASNSGTLALLESNPKTALLPIGIQTAVAGLSSSCFRIFLTPIDTLKTTLQTTGREGVVLLKSRVKTHGIRTLWNGALATAAANFVGYYPWFTVYNYLQNYVPKPDDLVEKLFRNAGIGFVSSVASDTISNSLRVVKTYRQTYPSNISYIQSVGEIVQKDGLPGLLGRGLKTRLLTNGLQGLMFSVLWKLFEDAYYHMNM